MSGFQRVLLHYKSQTLRARLIASCEETLASSPPNRAVDLCRDLQLSSKHRSERLNARQVCPRRIYNSIMLQSSKKSHKCHHSKPTPTLAQIGWFLTQWTILLIKLELEIFRFTLDIRVLYLGTIIHVFTLIIFLFSFRGSIDRLKGPE